MKSNHFANTWYNPTKTELLMSGIENVHVAFDLDSVLNELGDPLGQYIADRLCVDFDEVRQTDPDGFRRFHFGHPTVDDDQMRRLVNTYVEHCSSECPASPWMGQFVQYLHKISRVPLVVITARPESAMCTTYRWLERHIPLDVPFRLIMVNGMQKEVVLRRLGIECFVDDRYKTIARLKEVIDVSILYRRPWSTGRTESPGHFEIDDLRDLIPFINIMYGHRPMNWPNSIAYPNHYERRQY